MNQALNQARELILIVGGTGKTGSRVAERLRQRGQPLRVASRSAALPFDWHEPASWSAVLRDVKSVYLTYYPDLGAPGAAQALGAFSAQARDSGVEHLVLLSGRGEPGAQESERAVLASGVATTILRASFFCQNFSEGALLGSVLEGEIAFPAADVAEPFIDIDDIADVAVAALGDARHRGQVYELTGPRLLSFAQVAAALSTATERMVRYLPVTPLQYQAVLAQHVPPDYARFLSELFRDLFDGHNESLADGVQRVLGRAPRDFQQFAARVAATGVWQI